MTELPAQHGDALAQVRAIGLSGQMHGPVLLDEDGHVLRPAILWNNGRRTAQRAPLTQAAPAFAQITGNVAMPGFTAPKLLWVRAHEPELFARTARVLLLKNCLRFIMSGEAVRDARRGRYDGPGCGALRTQFPG